MGHSDMKVSLTYLRGLEVKQWDVGNCADMPNMFNGATYFNQDLTEWCVPNTYSTPTGFNAHTFQTFPQSNQPIWGTCP